MVLLLIASSKLSTFLKVKWFNAAIFSSTTASKLELKFCNWVSKSDNYSLLSLIIFGVPHVKVPSEPLNGIFPSTA
jgi:hypothetical protein